MELLKMIYGEKKRNKQIYLVLRHLQQRKGKSWSLLKTTVWLGELVYFEIALQGLR